MPRLLSAIRKADRRSQIAANQFQYPFVVDLAAKLVHQAVVVDLVEEAFQVDVHHPAFALLHITPGGIHRVVGAALGTKAVAVLAHLVVEGRAHDLVQRLLDQPVLYGRDAQPSASAVGLRYLDRAHRRRLIGSVQQLFPDTRPVTF